MKKRTDILLLMPSLAGFAVFFIIPFVYTFYYAFTENAFTGKFAGFVNFVALFGNRYFRLAMKNTLRFTALSVPRPSSSDSKNRVCSPMCSAWSS